MNQQFYESDRFKVAPLCPCGRSNRDGKFTPFVVEEIVDPQYGHCHSCGKTFFPGEPEPTTYNPNLVVTPKKALKFIDADLVKQTMKCYHQNNFALWLKSHYPEKAHYLLEYFSIGTTKAGGTIFWYQDRNGTYRKPKRIYYKMDGHRVKAHEDERKSAPSPLGFTNKEGFEYCLFGEFQLAVYPETAKIILVESEKTAVIGQSHFPEFIWLATGGATNLKKEKALCLQGRTVIIIPDMHNPGRNGAINMEAILNELLSKVLILDLDENRNDGGDLVDILANYSG